MNLTKQVWSKYFSSKILARGREYYRTDAVGELFFDPKNHLLTADVYGTEIYGVSVQLNAYDNDIEDMDCDCPYAFDGENCKHMAAVLFALETQGVPKRDNAECVKEISLEEAVQRLSEEEAKAYVLECAQKDTKLRDKLLLRASDAITPQQKSHWKKQIKSIIHESDHYEDIYGPYDEWEFDDIYSCLYDLSAFLDETVPELIRKQLYADAFDLVCDAYDIAHHSNLLEEGGYFFDFDNDCLQYWDEIIPNADEAEKQKMYQWLSKTAERDGFLGDLVDAFPDNPYLERDLQIIDAQIQNHTEDEDLLGHLAALRCEVMFRLGIPNGEIQRYRENYRYLYDVRRQEAQQAISSGKPEEAIRVALEGKELDKGTPHTAEWVKMLIDLYAQTAQAEKCKEELMHYTLHYVQDNLQYVMRLKEMTPAEDWASVRSQLLRSKSMHWRKCEFLHSEQMYRQLFEIAAAEGTTNLLFAYEGDFKDNFPEETRDAILRALDTEMQDAGKRGHYASIAQRLCRVRSYPDGEILANDMAMRWAQQYFRRYAMKEELQNAGFPVSAK